jgi:hypothetical protein
MEQDGKLLTQQECKDYVALYEAPSIVQNGVPLSFIHLFDVPSDYSGKGGYFVKVKADETGLEFLVA